MLKDLVDKKYLVFTNRGNFSIKAVLALVKHLSKKKILIQDQGGWLTYPQFIKKAKLEEVRIKTDAGLITKIDNLGDVLLFNSMPGYFALQDMSLVQKLCKKKNLLLINDVAGSIGTKEAKVGDIIIGSFGRWKPLNVEGGGFIATDNKEYYEFLKTYEEPEIEVEKLHLKLLRLNEKLHAFAKLHKKAKENLKSFDIIHPDKEGINVIVRFHSDDERERLINYCNEKKLEYVECPKYIRVNEDAISIEIKRLDL